ncbi:hypothetical protein DPMN_041387 [Dreissena polymorpha]|uniref:Uncharacterized protein n=1 Tax=Dreissena polymorpha TaxID=45954 RepID=A0A9D4CX47_DREPO|nr:hypothetical protein DPMN_041387 [Dreissena polymorpha]
MEMSLLKTINTMNLQRVTLKFVPELSRTHTNNQRINTALTGPYNYTAATWIIPELAVLAPGRAPWTVRVPWPSRIGTDYTAATWLKWRT